MEAPRPTLLTPQCAVQNKPLVQKEKDVRQPGGKLVTGRHKMMVSSSLLQRLEWVRQMEIPWLEEAHLLEEQRMQEAEQLLEQDLLLFEKTKEETWHNLLEAIQM